MGLKHQVMSSLRWTAGAKLVGQLINWSITLLVIRLLTPADYGLMAMANIVVGLLVMVADMGFGASLVHAKDLERRHASQVFGAALLVNAALCAVLVVGASPLATFFGEPRLAPVVSVLAFQFIVTAIGLVPSAMLKRALQYRTLSVVEIASAVSGNAVTLFLAWKGFGVWSLVLGVISTNVLRTLLLYVMTPDRTPPSFALRGARHLISFGANVTMSRVLWYVFLQTDVFIAGKLLGKEALGLYSVAVHLASLPMQRVGSVINDVAFSAFSRIQHDRRALETNVRLGVRQIALFAFPTMWGLACVAPDLVRLVMGDAWLASVIPLQIIAIAVPLRMVGTIVSTALVSTGRVDIAVKTGVINTLLAPPIFYVGAQFGIVGLSVAWAVMTPIMLATNLYGALPNFGLSALQVFSEIARPALAALAMATSVVVISISLAELHTAPRLVSEVVSGALLYFVVTLLINRGHALEALQLIAPGWLQRIRMRKQIR